MASSSLFAEARAVGACADRKIKRLQGAYLGSAASSAAARADLARLRRADDVSHWLSEGEILFEGLPELELPAARERRMLRAIEVSLRLFAWHQQSRDIPVAHTARDAADRLTFGRSCLLLSKRDEGKAEGVKRRLVSIEAAPGLREMEHHLRALVQLMRGADVQVDYRLLAQDLYLVQFEATREGVFMRWSRDLHAPFSQNAETGEAAAKDNR